MWFVGTLSTGPFEYLILTGSGSGTEGHSGRYLMNVTDYILDGEVVSSPESKPYEKNFARRGDITHTGVMEGKSVHVPDHLLALEHGRGFLFGSLPVVFAGVFFNTLDFVSLGKAITNNIRIGLFNR